MKELGARLKHYRENCELSQQQVANVLNIDRSTYTYYETGKTTPSASMLLKLSKIYNVPCAVFLECINQELALGSKVADSIDNQNDNALSEYDNTLDYNDKIYKLKKEEREFLIAYRALDEEKQKTLEQFLKSLIQK
ncbi:MAG: helix-turn-helix transcriptional regulator [Acutalibacteraceae bacterium]|nr:helix-turn-helix transcriptional regulator [Acutalibacteraceae bacterium]